MVTGTDTGNKRHNITEMQERTLLKVSVGWLTAVVRMRYHGLTLWQENQTWCVNINIQDDYK